MHVSVVQGFVPIAHRGQATFHAKIYLRVSGLATAIGLKHKQDQD